MESSTPVYVIVQIATGTPPVVDYGYLSLTIFLSAFLLILTGVVFYWLLDWLLIGIEAFLGIFRAIKQRRHSRDKQK